MSPHGHQAQEEQEGGHPERRGCQGGDGNHEVEHLHQRQLTKVRVRLECDSVGREGGMGRTSPLYGDAAQCNSKTAEDRCYI